MNEEKIKIEQGRTYIFKHRRYSDFLKLQVIEVTKFTYFFHNLDTGCKYRRGIFEFESDYKPIEEVGIIFPYLNTTTLINKTGVRYEDVKEDWIDFLTKKSKNTNK